MQTPMTRRSLFRRAVQAAWFGRRAGAFARGGKTPELEIDRVAGAGASVVHSRRYRVRATVSLLGITLYSRENVGGACAVVEEAVDTPSQAKITALQFASGSWPQRLRGFNRFGMTQEAVRQQGSRVSESAYLSFMTSSGETNFDQAKKAFLEAPSTLGITAAHGVATPAGYGAAVDRLSAPAGYTWLRCAELMEWIRARVSPAAIDARVRAGGAFPTFLFAARRAMLESKASARDAFVHNGNLFHLRTSTRDAKEPQWKLTIGRIARQGTGRETEFRVWHRPGDPATLPARIEFRPKNYLHLVFEQDPAVPGPVVPSLISKEPA